MAVHVGQCFMKVGVPYTDIWQVVAIRSPAGFGEAHARLTRLERPADSKTVCVSALEDGRLYRVHDAGQVLRRRLGP